jgi:hypothetical protein
VADGLRHTVMGVAFYVLVHMEPCCMQSSAGEQILRAQMPTPKPGSFDLI